MSKKIYTKFNDNGIVMYKLLNHDYYEKCSLESYIEKLDRDIKNNRSNAFLMYDEESKELYLLLDLFDRKKFYFELTDDLKREFENNENTKFNKKMRELLEFSELKSKFFAINEKGTFDSVEEADFYARYLEKYENNNESYNDKLLNARKYIINKSDKNSDIYKYHFLKETSYTLNKLKKEINLNDNNIRSEKREKHTYVKSEVLCLAILIVFGFAIYDAFLMESLAKIIFFMILFGPIIIAASSLLLFFIKESNKEIKKYSCNIKEYESENKELKKELEKVLNDIEVFNKEINSSSKNNVSKTEDKKETEVNNKDKFNSELESFIVYLNSRIVLLDESDQKEVRDEINEILIQYKNNYIGLIKNSCFVSEECLMLKINLFKSLKVIHSKIEEKIEIENKIDAFENHISKSQELLYNKGEVRVLEKH